MSLITNTDTTILPYNDDHMVYDLDRHMYVLTEKGISDLVGFDIVLKSGNQTEADLIRYEVSQDILNYISRYSTINSLKFKVYAIAKQQNYREVFKRALADQFRYYYRSGAGVIKDMHGINISGGKVMDLANLRNQVLISPSAETLLGQSGLLYSGHIYNSDYTEDGSW